jgi:hypothetical protein
VPGFGIRVTVRKEDFDNAVEAGLEPWQWYSDQTAHAVQQWWKAADEAEKTADPNQRITVSVNPSEKHPLIFVDVHGTVA